MFIQYGAMAQVVDWIAESGKIYYLGGNVGIGTQNPSAKVDVHDVNGNSVQLQTATGEGLYISRATKSGILIDSAGDNGISPRHR
ncbi:hypothetical protein KFU94_36175 [Chloroflexi bacterium TSY]|nr:hypothetical protein [Chloroflexi bacterium TSY]